MIRSALSVIRTHVHAFAVAAALLLPVVAIDVNAASPALAQSQATDLATPPGVPLLTNTARVATGAAINSVNQTNVYNRGVVCTWATSASSGSTSSTFGIQSFDVATAQWTTLKTSAAILSGSGATDAPNTPHSVAIYPGMAVSSLPTNYEAQSVPLPKTWRVTETITAGGGTNPSPAVTSKVGCNYLN